MRKDRGPRPEGSGSEREGSLGGGAGRERSERGRQGRAHRPVSERAGDAPQAHCREQAVLTKGDFLLVGCLNTRGVRSVPTRNSSPESSSAARSPVSFLNRGTRVSGTQGQHHRLARTRQVPGANPDAVVQAKQVGRAEGAAWHSQPPQPAVSSVLSGISKPENH